jgi:hypothetical protein
MDVTLPRLKFIFIVYKEYAVEVVQMLQCREANVYLWQIKVYRCTHNKDLILPGDRN